MKRDMLGYLCCPDCKAPLSLKVEAENPEEILEGTLTCGKCSAAFPIEAGIPHLMPKELRDKK
jgi:uncharacterized protein YbaR (Trm112 family)